MTKYIPYLIYLWLIAMHQVFLSDVTSIFGAKINLAVLIVILIAMFKTEISALWFGFIVGIVGFVGMSEITHALIMALLGVIAFQLKERMNLESLFAKIMLILGGVLLHNIILLFIELNDGYIQALLTKAFPGAVYTIVIGWIFFLFKDEKLTLRKIKSIF